VRNLNHPIKILGQGDLPGALHVHAHAFSASAQAKITAAGGTCTFLDPQIMETVADETQTESA
jgi:large subunit ribosomal protein L15